MFAALTIGWAEQDITPRKPVLIAGQFSARVSEGVLDPLTATVLAIESDGEHVVWVSCDLVGIADEFRDAVRARLDGQKGLEPKKVILHATHSHTGPDLGGWHAKVDLPWSVMTQADLLTFTADRVAEAVIRAWTARAPGGVSFGLGHAVVGRNRRWVDQNGKSTMYGDISKPNFSHIEGFEDHNVNLLATYDLQGALTGVILNIACPAQVTESLFSLSADFWHDTRLELRRRLGLKLFVGAQCSTAGDIAPHFYREQSYDQKAAVRMLKIKQRTVRQEIAHRLANATEEVLPFLAQAIERNPILKHRVETLALPLNRLTERDVADARKEAAVWHGRYESEKMKIDAEPPPPGAGRWYVAVTNAYARMGWNQGVLDRFELQRTSPTHPTHATEVHVVRLGEIVFATNPFEYYLDYGIQIKARSPATQTFLVQLAGSGTYVPSPRSVTGGGYGSLPASNPVGSEGGELLREKTLRFIEAFWP
ncbi:MAG: hypothetical protein Q8N18_06915 [Opitutaceae bacterium]|nr:hypothetical protein [Opitutaceae bacterium]